MVVTAPLPAPLKVLQSNLRRAREPALRARLQTAIAGVRRLYGLDNKPQHEETGDLRRRRLGLRPSQQRPMSPKAAESYRRQWRDRLAREEKP